MKIRKGFVSNSSSSSFILAVGVVIDWVKFNKWRNKSSDEYDVRLYDVEDEVTKNDDYPEWKFDGSAYVYDAPTNVPTHVYLNKEDYDKVRIANLTEIEAKNLLIGKGNKDVVIYCIGNDEGDGAFQDSDYDLDYNIDLIWFNREQQRMYNTFSEENGISCIHKIFGAGRNG